VGDNGLDDDRSVLPPAHAARGELHRTNARAARSADRAPQLHAAHQRGRGAGEVRSCGARSRALGGEAALLSSFAAAFALPGQWVTVDPSTLDVSLPTGEFRFAWNMMGLRYSEAEVTYTAGLATVPNAVKVACAQIVRNAQTTPGLNVKSSKLDTLETQYFSDSLIDSQVQALLRPYVAERLG
jgi:hypothetical protein